MTTKYSWVLPVWNEEQSVSLVIAEIGQVMGQKSYEIIVINDGSDDQTKKVLKKVSNSRLKVVNLALHQGKWACLSLGFKLAQGKFIITLDSDLQDDPREVVKLIKKINQGYDVVSGWRKKGMIQFIKSLSPTWGIC